MGVLEIEGAEQFQWVREIAKKYVEGLMLNIGKTGYLQGCDTRPLSLCQGGSISCTSGCMYLVPLLIGGCYNTAGGIEEPYERQCYNGGGRGGSEDRVN